MWLSWICTIFLATVVTALPPPPTPQENQCRGFLDSEKFDCFPEEGPNQQGCELSGCCWAPNERLQLVGVPSCFYPRNYGGYEYVNKTTSPEGSLAYLKKTFTTYPRDVPLLRLEVHEQTNQRVRIKISDAENERYETAYPKISKTNGRADSPEYLVDIDTEQDGFRVLRASNNEVLFSSRNLGGFIFSDWFLQISSTFNGTIYGLGEHRSTLALNTNWNHFTMFNRDIPPGENANLYGSHPFYLVINAEGVSYGVYLHNSNAMGVTLQPLDAITFRPIGGILDFYFFMGPTPADVVRQYTELVGRPLMPPYWSLGFHLCRVGYQTSDDLRDVWQKNRNTGVPFDVQWSDYDYMANKNDFTVDKDRYGRLAELIDDIHAAGMHWVPIVDCGIGGAEPPGTYPPLDEALAEDVLIKDQNGSIYYGLVWNPGSTVWPDFSNPKTFEYWKKQLTDFHELAQFDGIWIDMNEPSNIFGPDVCPVDILEHPLYNTGVVDDKLSAKTICMTAKQYGGLHYNLHNVYGIAEAEATNLALRSLQKRPFVISRSTFSGSGAYTGHWSGDNLSSWYDMVKSVTETLVFNILGIPLVGADICGFRGDTTEALCNRWAQLGAFYPFSRNHNGGSVPQDPASFGKETVSSIKKAYGIRYSLLPYLYTLFYFAHVNGDTVARPLAFEFPQDINARTVDTSFLWGSGLYIIPVLEENKTEVTAYLPAGKWYDFYTLAYKLWGTGGEVTLPAPYDTIPIFIRGGSVIPTQEPEETTAASRKNNFSLLVAGDKDGKAGGHLFWDDGESLDTIENGQYGFLTFSLADQQFTSTVEQWNTEDTPLLEAVRILGDFGGVTSVTVNGEDTNFSLDDLLVLTVTGLQIPLNTSIEIKWEISP